MNPYETLVQRLDRFIRKFYLNQLLKGILLLTACILIISLLLVLSEYFLYLPAWIKIALLSLFVAGSVYALIRFILLPLLKMQKLGKIISYRQAAAIIGQHFPEVSDKLLNLLQLREKIGPLESRSLALAGIEQKTKELSPVPFIRAIPFQKNVKYLRVLIPTIAIGILLFLFVPQIFKEGGKRLFSPTESFSPPPPFNFQLLNPLLSVPYNGDYKLEVKVQGDKLPQELRIELDGESLPMEKVSPDHFVFNFTKVRQPVHFKVSGAGYYSSGYQLRVMKVPLPEGFEIHLQYPAYINRPPDQLQSLSDIRVPEGTRLRWIIQAKFTEDIRLHFGANSAYTLPLHYDKRQDHWHNNLVIHRDTSYQIVFSGKGKKLTDSFQYLIGVDPDQKPVIQLSRISDSITGKQIALAGQASDDYKITRVNFHYYLTDPEGLTLRKKTIPVPIQAGKIVPFQHYFDIATVPIQAGQVLYYYVKAWDNDGVNGSKSASSQVFSYREPSTGDLDTLIEQNNDLINEGLSQSSKQSEEQDQAMEQLQKELLESNTMDWEQQQKLTALAERQKKIKEQLEALQKRFDLQQQQTDQQNLSDNLKTKQEEVRKQIDRLLDEELQKQLKALEELMARKNKDQTFNALQKLQQENQLFQMDLERVQELLQQLELQMETEALAKKIEQLADDQAGLEEKTKPGETAADLKNEQDKLQQQLQNLLNKELDKLQKTARQQAEEISFSEPEQQGEQAGEEMQESSRNLNNNQAEQSRQHQQNAQKNLREMAQNLTNMASGMDIQQLNIDIKAVRQLLANLIRYSFEQENLINTTGKTPVTSPEFRNNTQKQKALKDQAKMIRDSLSALGKRVFQLAPAINKETFELGSNIDQAIRFLENRRVREATVKQQFAMTHGNNLALLLNETLSNMMQMQAQMQGRGQPGSSGKSKGGQQSGEQKMKDIISGQQQMGKGMQKMQGRSGKSGQSEDGQEGDRGQSEGNAEQIAKMAQHQAALRRQIQELSSMLNSKGGGNSETTRLLKDIQNAMNQQETDLVNKKLNSVLQQRQEDIMTRLLKAERAIRQQEEDDQRSANTGQDQPRPIPADLEQFLKEKRAFFDAYRTSPASLKPFYKNISEAYLNQVR